MEEQNVESIDLKDDKNKIIIQVTSTCTRTKIKKKLNKKSLKRYSQNGYRVQFIFIDDTAKKQKNKVFENPYNILFNPLNDIFDITDISRIIHNMGIEQQKLLYDFIKKELGNEPDILKIDSNLATIINILANEDFLNEKNGFDLNEYDISRKIDFNNLKFTKDIINDYKIYYYKVDEKYQEFDRQGKNKSLSVFQKIRMQYKKLQTQEKYNQDQIFLNIIENIKEIIQKSANYIEIPYEELDLCVGILVVDAFIRCKIFENPEGYNHVVT